MMLPFKGVQSFLQEANFKLVEDFAGESKFVIKTDNNQNLVTNKQK